MRRVLESYSYTTTVFFIVALLGVALTLLSEPRVARSQVSGAAIAGYLWSDNIGWIDVNCSNAGVCGSNPFGLSISSSGVVSGYAWSDNIGWISANSSDLGGCPSAPCTANITGGTVIGWFKALAADGNGWDGWISLSGTSPSYGPTLLASGVFAGYAWGSDVVGWIDFQYATTPYNTCTSNVGWSCLDPQTIKYTDASCNITTTACTPPSFCVSGSSVCLYPTPVAIGALTVSPKFVAFKNAVQVSWNISNVQSCTVVGTNGDGTGSNSTGVWNTNTKSATSTPITGQTTYTLSCVPLDPAAALFTETATVSRAPSYRER